MVDVTHRHVDAAGEVGVEGEELVQKGAGVAVEDVDLRTAAGAGAGDEDGLLR